MHSPINHSHLHVNLPFDQILSIITMLRQFQKVFRKSCRGFANSALSLKTVQSNSHGFTGAVMGLTLLTTGSIVICEQNNTQLQDVTLEKKEHINIVTAKNPTLKDKAHNFDFSGYVRIDGHILDENSTLDLQSHLVHGTLFEETLLEGYECYYNAKTQDLVTLVFIGDKLNGHAGIVHGGISATLLDNCFGWLATASKKPLGFTVYLNVNYKRMVPQNSLVIIQTKFTEISGRKQFMSGTLSDVDGNIMVDATTLFVVPRSKDSTAAKV